MRLQNNFKGQFEGKYLLLICVFVGMLGLSGMLFGKDIIVKDTNNENLGFIADVLINLTSQNIPLLSQLTGFLLGVWTLSYVHPYIMLLFTLMLGIPLTYVLMRLLRGGG